MATDQEYKYEEISVQVESKGELFEAKGKKILQYGWKLYEECFKNVQGMAMEEFCASEKEFPEVIKETIFRCVPVQKTVHYTTPPKEYTEDTLLAAMETAGNKDFEKETEKKGLGTPATRASIIEKLVFSKYAIRKGKQISCTEDGKLLIEVVPDYLKSAALTAECENKLLEMEKGSLTDQSFLEGIKGMVMLLISDCRKLSSEQTHKFDTRKSIGTCPVCGNPVYGGKKNFYCSNRDCSFVLWKENNFLEKMGKTMDEAIATALLQKGRVTMTDLYSAKKNKYFNADNAPRGSRRMTSDVSALATAVLFQSPVQHFALAPNNLTDAPEWAIGFMKEVPTTWDEVRFIDGYPGKYVVMARRHGDKWYVAGVNAQKETVKLKIALPMFMPGDQVRVFTDNEELQGNVKQIKVNKKQELQLAIPCNGGILIVE